MSIHRRPTRAPYVRRGTPKASPVTITRADGTTEQQPALKARQVERVVRKGERQARTWDTR